VPLGVEVREVVDTEEGVRRGCEGFRSRADGVVEWEVVDVDEGVRRGSEGSRSRVVGVVLLPRDGALGVVDADEGARRGCEGFRSCEDGVVLLPREGFRVRLVEVVLLLRERARRSNVRGG